MWVLRRKVAILPANAATASRKLPAPPSQNGVTKKFGVILQIFGHLEQEYLMSWNLEKIQALLAAQVEEYIHVDYKAADALTLAEGKKTEISKDVSAFANSDGGVIIYGVREYIGEKEHLPEKLDPVSRQQVSKETLEQIINQRVSPRIHGLLIHPIVVSDARPDDVLYVVEIPKGNTAHQASDKRYYRRYNFLSIPMEDWEIKDIINRQMRTAAEVRLVPRFTKTFELDFHPQGRQNTLFSTSSPEIQASRPSCCWTVCSPPRMKLSPDSLFRRFPITIAPGFMNPHLAMIIAHPFH